MISTIGLLIIIPLWLSLIPLLVIAFWKRPNPKNYSTPLNRTLHNIFGEDKQLPPQQERKEGK